MTRSRIALFVAMVAFAGAALAESKTVILEVPGMNCAACPITIKKALKDVSGVETVNVTFEPKEAVVTFDDKKTSVHKLRDATRDAGYPSSVKTVSTATK